MGNIDLGGGANGFANNAGAVLYSGTLINLGDPANVFTNNGLISPGAEQLAVKTQLFGSYLQTATGVADMEIDLARRVTDRLIATGTVSVAGRINLSLMNTHTIRSGTTWQPLFNGARWRHQRRRGAAGAAIPRDQLRPVPLSHRAGRGLRRGLRGARQDQRQSRRGG